MAADLNYGTGCPQCGVNTQLLHSIDQGMRLRLEKEGTPTTFSQVCTNCFKELSRSLSNASLLQAEKVIKENFRKSLWKNRLNLLRLARSQLESKQHAEAAVSYEKYLKIIETVYMKKRHEITAPMFKEHPREVTLIASALWALVEVYDLHQNYWEKQNEAATKLGELLPYTNLFASIVKQAALKKRHAKNPQAYRNLLRSANVSSGNCFIASIAFENRNDPTLVTLRAFRDRILAPHPAGRVFIRTYYRWSPGLANRLQHSKTAKSALQSTLPKFAACLKSFFNL